MTVVIARPATGRPASRRADLPGDVAEGDYPIFHGAGAYSVVTNTRFNGFGEMARATVRTRLTPPRVPRFAPPRGAARLVRCRGWERAVTPIPAVGEKKTITWFSTWNRVSVRYFFEVIGATPLSWIAHPSPISCDRRHRPDGRPTMNIGNIYRMLRPMRGASSVRYAAGQHWCVGQFTTPSRMGISATAMAGSLRATGPATDLPARLFARCLRRPLLAAMIATPGFSAMTQPRRARGTLGLARIATGATVVCVPISAAASP